MKKQTEKLPQTVISNYNRKILNLWKKNGTLEETKITPFLHHELYKNAVLFIGINPSYSKKQILKAFKRINGYEKYLKNIDEYYSFKNYDKFKKDHKNYDIIRRAENRSEINKAQYFDKFNDLAKQVDSEWEHIDLFNIRLTKQKEVKKLSKANSDFFEQQAKINLELLNPLKPKIIIVVNALASKIIKERFNFIFNEKLGTYTISISNKVIPVFFSGMLSGQRALDIETLERLKWHLRFVNRLLY